MYKLIPQWFQDIPRTSNARGFSRRRLQSARIRGMLAVTKNMRSVIIRLRNCPKCHYPLFLFLSSRFFFVSTSPSLVNDSPLVFRLPLSSHRFGRAARQGKLRIDIANHKKGHARKRGRKLRVKRKLGMVEGRGIDRQREVSRNGTKLRKQCARI